MKNTLKIFRLQPSHSLRNVIQQYVSHILLRKDFSNFVFACVQNHVVINICFLGFLKMLAITIGRNRDPLCTTMVNNIGLMLSITCRMFRDGQLENLWGAGEVQKQYSRQGKLNEKNSCTPINPKKKFML